MASFEKALLDKLDHIIGQQCDLCAERLDRCPQCSRPIGATRDEARRARAGLDILLERRRDRLDASSAWISSRTHTGQ